MKLHSEMEGQAAQDLAMFSEVGQNSNLDEKASKKPARKVERAEKSMTEKEIRTVAAQFNPPVDDTDAKASVLRKIKAYEREFPEKLANMKTTKATEAKASLEELKIRLKDIEHELGKSGGLDMVRIGFVELCKGIERVQLRTNVLPYDLTHFGEVAVEAVNPRINPVDGSVQVGEVVPLLQEFVIKHDDWFSTRVEVRLALQVFAMMSAVDKMNKEGVKIKEQTKAASGKKTASGRKVNDL